VRIFDFFFVHADDEIYSCKKVLESRVESGPGGIEIDYAVVQLDRRVSKRKLISAPRPQHVYFNCMLIIFLLLLLDQVVSKYSPATIASDATAVAAGSPLTMIGFPSG
jgi:hypothetical protein